MTSDQEAMTMRANQVNWLPRWRAIFVKTKGRKIAFVRNYLTEANACILVFILDFIFKLFVFEISEIQMFPLIRTPIHRRKQYPIPLALE